MRAIFRKIFARFYKQNPRNITLQNIDNFIPKDILNALDSMKSSIFWIGGGI